MTSHPPLPVLALVATLSLALPSAAQPVELVAFGDTSPGGALSLEIHGVPGAPTLLAVGFGFLSPPAKIQGEPFFIDPTLPWLQIPLGAMPAGGLLVLPTSLPSDAALLGIRLHLHAAAPTLSPVTTIAIHDGAQLVAPAPAESKLGLQLFVGELDGDTAFGDYAVGAPEQFLAGAVHVAFGPNPDTTLTLLDPTPQFGALFGASIDAGQFVGDAAIDLVVGAPGSGASPAEFVGEVWIFEGPDFVNATRIDPPGGGTPNFAFGYQLQTGDFDGDGDDDLAIAEPSATVAGTPLAGRVHVYLGPTLTLASTLQEAEPDSGSLFGAALAAGDMTGDGKDELVVGVPAAKVQGQVQVGEAWIYAGPLDSPPTRVLDPNPSGGAAFACRVELADLVGDATLDLISGTPGGAGTPENNPLDIPRVGEAIVFDGADLSQAIVFEDPSPEELGHYGFGVEAADVDGDGANDLLVGANLARLGSVNAAGEVFVLLGPDFQMRLELSAPIPELGAEFGTFLAGVDIDGDGRDELLVTSPDARPGGLVDAGSVLVFDL